MVVKVRSVSGFLVAPFSKTEGEPNLEFVVKPHGKTYYQTIRGALSTDRRERKARKRSDRRDD